MAQSKEVGWQQNAWQVAIRGVEVVMILYLRQSIFMKRFYLKSLLFSLFFVGFGLASQAQSNNNFEVSKNIDIYNSLFKELNLNYVDEINPGALNETAIKALLEDLDPYTVFVAESQIEDMRMMTTGEYGGIGSLIQQMGDYVIISEPYEGFPAQKAGLIPGDIILEINGLNAIKKTSAEISELLKGVPASTLTLKIQRSGTEQPFMVELTREKIKLDNIPYYTVLDSGVGYILLTGFTQKAASDVKDVFLKMKEQTTLKGLVIDLRGNGGGLLNEAVDIANIFVNKNELIVSTKGKSPDRTSIHRTRMAPIDLEIPLVVLVNEASASASEIVAGALQDLDRAVIVGQKTFGKGLVQNVVPLTYNTQLKITVAKYYIPSGRCIQAIDYSHIKENGGKIPDSLMSTFKTRSGRVVFDNGGITPDVVLTPFEYSPVTANLYISNLFFGFANAFALKNKTIPPAEDFEINDTIYHDFMEYVSEKGFVYTTESEKMIEELKKIADEESYLSDVESQLLALEEQFKVIKENDLRKHRPEIETILRSEIASRYYYQKGKIVAALKHDQELEKAVELILNTDRYKEIFTK